MPGDETGGQQTKIGLMAQDVAQVNPEAVGDMGGGLLGVDYKRATAPAETMAEGGQVGPVDRFAFASRAGDLGHFQNVDPTFARIVESLGPAVDAIKKHSDGGARDYNRGKSEGQVAGHEEGFAKGGEVERSETRLKEMERKLQETEKRSAEYAKRLDGIERTSSMKPEKKAGGGGISDLGGMGLGSLMGGGLEPFGPMSGIGLLQSAMGKKPEDDDQDSKSIGPRMTGMGLASGIPKIFAERGMGALPHMASGGSPLNIAPLPYESRDASYVPKSKLATGAPMQGSAPDMPSSGGVGGQDSLGAFKQFGNDAIDYFTPKPDVGLHDWTAGTSVIPAGFAAGGAPIDPGTLPF